MPPRARKYGVRADSFYLLDKLLLLYIAVVPNYVWDVQVWGAALCTNSAFPLLFRERISVLLVKRLEPFVIRDISGGTCILDCAI